MAPRAVSSPVLGLLGVFGCLGLLLAGCKRVDPVDAKLPALKPAVFSDSFDRAELGPEWRDTASPGVYRIVGGELVARGAYNHPLWLTRALPRDAVIEIDAWSNSPAGDIKVEAFGDGKSFAQQASYTSSGYVFIQGGWSNRFTVLVRQDEHANDRRQRQDLPVEQRRRYHWVIARHGEQVDWFIDGKLAHSLVDAEPLAGPEHSFFALNDWEAELHFDNLVIRPY